MMTSTSSRPSEQQTSEHRTSEHPAADQLRLPPHRNPVLTDPRWRTRRVGVTLYAVVLIVLPALVVAGFMVSGWWATTGTSTSVTEAGTGATGIPMVPDDVKGSMTVDQVLAGFPQVTAEEIFLQFGVATDLPASTQLKTLVESGNGLDLPGLRVWLAAQ